MRKNKKKSLRIEEATMGKFLLKRRKIWKLFESEKAQGKFCENIDEAKLILDVYQIFEEEIRKFNWVLFWKRFAMEIKFDLHKSYVSENLNQSFFTTAKTNFIQQWTSKISINYFHSCLTIEMIWIKRDTFCFGLTCWK